MVPAPDLAKCRDATGILVAGGRGGEGYRQVAGCSWILEVED